MGRNIVAMRNRRIKKGKYYISSITRVLPSAKNPYKGTMKRIIVELMTIIKEDGISSDKKSKRCVFKYWDTEKVGRIPSDIFPLAITEK